MMNVAGWCLVAFVGGLVIGMLLLPRPLWMRLAMTGGAWLVGLALAKLVG